MKQDHCNTEAACHTQSPHLYNCGGCEGTLPNPPKGTAEPLNKFHKVRSNPYPLSLATRCQGLQLPQILELFADFPLLVSAQPLAGLLTLLQRFDLTHSLL